MTVETMTARIQEIKSELRTLRDEKAEAEAASIDATRRAEKGEWTIDQASVVWDQLAEIKARIDALFNEKITLEDKMA